MADTHRRRVSPPPRSTPATPRTRPPGRSTPIYASSTFAQDGVGGLRAVSSTPAPETPPDRLWRGAGGGRRGQVRPRLQLRDGRQRLRPSGRPSPRRPIVIPDDAYGGTFRLIDKVCSGSGASTHPGAPVRPRRGSCRDHRRHPDDLGGDAHQPAAVDRRHRRDRRHRPCGGGQRFWWTTPSPRRRCSSR